MYEFVHEGAAFTPNGRTDNDPETADARNRRLSREEVASFKRDDPGPVFAYASHRHVIGDMRGVDELRAGDKITTWMGDKLATVTRVGDPWRDNFGGRRQHVRCLGINGAVYSGTAYLSSGDYVRLRPMKTKRGS